MKKKYLLIIAALIISLSLVSCGESKKSSYSTENLKKFVEKMKKNDKTNTDKLKKEFKGYLKRD